MDGAATDDAERFMRLLSPLLESALDASGRAVLLTRLASAFEDIYSEVPARRLAVVGEVIAGTGLSAPDELDFVAFFTRQVLSEYEAPLAVAARVDLVLDQVRQFAG